MSNGIDFKKIAIESRELMNAALARETALREELALIIASFDELAACVDFSEARLDQTGDSPIDCANQLQQRLTVAEQRVDLLEGLLKSGSSPTHAHCSAVMEALKPAEVEGS